jgi:hypothetical protein
MSRPQTDASQSELFAAQPFRSTADKTGTQARAKR